MLSIPDVKEIVDELDAVCVEIRFIELPLKPLGLVVIADRELLLANLSDIVYDIPYIFIIPSNVPAEGSNLTALIALVVFAYPAGNVTFIPAVLFNSL